MSIFIDFSAVSVCGIEISRSVWQKLLPVLTEFLGEVPDVGVSVAFDPSSEEQNNKKWIEFQVLFCVWFEGTDGR